MTAEEYLKNKGWVDAYEIALFSNLMEAYHKAKVEAISEKLKEIVKMQEECYGDGMKTHIRLSSLCEEAKQLLKQ